MKRVESDELLVEGDKAIIEVEIPIHAMVEGGKLVRDINGLLIDFREAYKGWKGSWQSRASRPHKKVTVNFEES